MASPDFSQIGGSTDGPDKRSFWNRPEGVAGALFIIALGGLGLYYLNPLLEFLIRLTQNTISLIASLAVLGVLVFLLTSRDVRTGMFFLFKTMMRSFAGTIIQLNPIAIMKIYVQDLKEKREKMSGQIDTLAGQLAKLNRTINDNNGQIKQKFAEANKANSIAERPGMREAAQLATIEGAGLQEMNEKLLPLQRNMQTVLAFMEKVNKSAEYIIKETEIKVKLKETEYKIVKESSNALRTAVSIFKGNPDKKFYFDESMEYIQDDMSQKLGEMKRAMDLSMDFINGVDIQNGILTDKGQALLDAYNKNEFKLIQLDAQPDGSFGTNNPITRPIPGQAEPPKDAGYRNLLD
jgi:outer membrane murein-binding lipoprotein Lpp